MIGAEEKRRLMERVGNDGIGPLRAVLRCVAGLLVLFVIAAGPWTFLSSGRYAADQAARAPHAERAESKAALERRDQELSCCEGAAKEGAKARQVAAERSVVAQ